MVLQVSLAQDIMLGQNNTTDCQGAKMSPEERKEFIQIFNEGIEQVILPYFARIQEEIAGIHIELSEIKQDVAVLKQDVAVLKQDVAVLKQDVAVLKQDVAVLKQDVAVLKQDVAVLKQDVAVLKQDVAVLKEEMSGVKQEIRGIKGILQDHGLRLDRIERKLDVVVTRQDEQEIEIKQLKDRLA